MKNNPKGIYRFAEILYHGDGIEENKKRASEFYIIADDNGNLKAMKKNGDILFYRDGIDTNKQEGQTYQKNAIEEKKKFSRIKRISIFSCIFFKS